MTKSILRGLGLLVLATSVLSVPAQARMVRSMSSADVSARAGATPIEDGGRTFAQFHGKPGIKRIASNLVDLNEADPRIAKSFRGIDLKHLKHMLAAQFCYILGGSCIYTGRSMPEAHASEHLTDADMGALVENLQKAMDREGVPFRAQNRLLAKLAPMKRDVVGR